MTHINDALLTKYSSVSSSSNLNVAFLDWLQANGATSNNINEAQREFLISQGVTLGSIDVMWRDYFVAQGYTGSLVDMWMQFSMGPTFSLPSDLGSLTLWLDGSDPTTMFTDTGGTTQVSSDGDTVRRINDKSDNALAFTSTSTLADYKTNRQNGLSALFCNTDTFTASSVPMADMWGSEAMTIMGVIKQSPGSPHTKMLRHGTTAGNIVLAWTPFSSSLFWDAGIESTARISVAKPAGFDNNYVLCEFWRSGTSSEIYVNGTEEQTGTVSGDWTAASLPLEFSIKGGDLCEMVACNEGLGEADRTNLRNYFNSKWAIY